jgi:hypothetical protein
MHLSLRVTTLFAIQWLSQRTGEESLIQPIEEKFIIRYGRPNRYRPKTLKARHHLILPSPFPIYYSPLPVTTLERIIQPIRKTNH